MTSNKPGDEQTPDSEPENSSSDENQTPEAVAAAAINSAQASAKDAEMADSGDDTESDPLGFDDARMPDSGLDQPDLSTVEGTESEADSGEDNETDSDDSKDEGSESADSDDKADADKDDAEPDLEAQLAAANAKVDDHWARILRMQADLENERKRAQKQVSSAHKFAIEKFAEELLPIKDSLEMGLEAAKAEDADLGKIVEGSELTLKLLSQAFEKNQIVEVDPLDDKFDPNVHQAMSMQEVEGKEANTVIGVMQKGYTLNDRLIRPALVTVSK